MDPEKIALASLALSVLNTCGVVWGIRRHCKADDKRAGAMEEMTRQNERRIECIERRAGLG